MIIKDIQYDNWMTKKNCVHVIKELSDEFYLKTTKLTNNNLNKNYKTYDPWMMPTLIFPNLSNILDQSYNKTDIFTFQINIRNYLNQIKEKEKFEELLGVSLIDLKFETNRNYIEDYFLFYSKSLNIIKKINPWIFEIYHLIVKNVLFIDARVKKIKAMSSHILKGTIIFRCYKKFSRKNLILQSIDIAHEIAHQSLMILLASDPIIKSAYNALVYSGAKKCNRPAIKSFHSAIALKYMIELISDLLISNIIFFSDNLKNQLEKHNDSLKYYFNLNIDSLIKNCEFSELGFHIIREICNKKHLYLNIRI